MHVLGINSVYHESSAALIVNGQIVAAAEEERFNRRKHGKQARIDNPDELPWSSIRYCLEWADVHPSKLDAVAYSFDPQMRRLEYQSDPYATAGDWGHPDGEETFLHHLQRVPDALSVGLGVNLIDRFRWIPHHVAHAASAYYPSGFDRAGILVVDGIGEAVTALLGHYEGGQLEVLQRVFLPDSLGFLWEKLSRFLGFTEYDACKVMGLAAYGDPDLMRSAIHKLVWSRDGGFGIDADLLQFRRHDFDGLTSLLGSPGTWLGEREQSLAAALQTVTEEIFLSLARYIHNCRPADALCIAGGVGLNCQANWGVKEEGPYERVYVPSAPHDAGTAIGAALACAHEHTEPGVGLIGSPTRSPYLGPAFSAEQVDACLRQHGLDATRPACIEREAARQIAEGKIVAWFQGRMEFGPRALGNRSLLADPRNPEIREILNVKVKHREVYRPFAPSVLAERAADWLILGRGSDSYAYMSFTPPVRPERITEVPAVVHRDGTARAQVVTAESNPRFHRLLREFEALTGVPLVLNTSFNDGEPIVCSPADAVKTFLATRIDTLVLGDVMVTR
jgi:carbamoyltransferase